MQPPKLPARGNGQAGNPPRPSAHLPIAVEVDGRRQPITNRPPADLAPTLPPPAFHPQPIPVEYRKHSTALEQPPLVAPHAPLTRDDHEERTAVGLGPSTLHGGAEEQDEGDRPSTVQAVKSAHTLAELLAERSAELATARAELEAAKRPAPVAEPEFDASAYFRKWRDDALKLFIPIVAIAFAASLAIALLLKFTTDLKLDNTKAIQDTQQKTTQTVEDRLKALEKYANALAKHSDCIDAQRDSAIERGTGHVVDGDHEVDWAQQNKPALKLRVLWDTAPWSPVNPCPARPRPPPAPP